MLPDLTVTGIADSPFILNVKTHGRYSSGFAHHRPPPHVTVWFVIVSTAPTPRWLSWGIFLLVASQNSFHPCHVTPGAESTSVLLPLPASSPLKLGDSGPCSLCPGGLRLVGSQFTRRNDLGIHPAPAQRPCLANSKFPRKSFRPRVERKRSSSQSGCYIQSPEP